MTHRLSRSSSDYNSKRRAHAALDDLLNKLNVPWIIVSFNNEGYHDPAHLYEMLTTTAMSTLWKSTSSDMSERRSESSIRKAKKVGVNPHLRNKEVLFVVGPIQALVDRASTAALTRMAALSRGHPPRSSRSSRAVLRWT